MISCKLCIEPAKGANESDDAAKTKKIKDNTDVEDSFCKTHPLKLKDDSDGASNDDYIEKSD